MPSFNSVRSLQRGLLILQIINQHSGMRASDVAKLSRIPRPTVYRLLETLETLGFVVIGPSDDCWRPTLKVKSLSSGFRDEAWVAQLAMPSMMALSRKILWPVDLVTFRNYAMVVRESTHAHSPLSVDVGMVGRELPLLLTAAGRAYLAFCPKSEREAILDVLRASDARENALARNDSAVDRILCKVRELEVGFRTEGYRPNTGSISAPIRMKDRVIACVTIIWIRSAMTLEEAVAKHRSELQQTTRFISENLERGLTSECIGEDLLG